ncbi:hypothetical protein [Robertmurraya sp. P23]|uniref:hypothetical protein n=1 Tax=Robertmurraya sp. P23 TaxID=3436931 RepID=UPI003D96F7E9
MTKKFYTSPKVISHQAIKFETLISGPTEEPEDPGPGEPIIPIIDIKPNSDPSSYGSNPKGSIPVALLGSSNFDVSKVEDSTVRFGDTPNQGAEASHVGIEDYNKDGYMDKVYHFPFEQTNLDPQDKVGYLSGKFNGETFLSSSDVNITGKKK